MPRLLLLVFVSIWLLHISACRSIDEAAAPESWGELIIDQQHSGTDELLIGLHAVDENVVWAGGTGGTFVRTVDGGLTWHSDTVAGADTLQFRDVHALDSENAYLLSIGTGSASRVYRTTDGGTSWDLVFVNDIEEAFFDCLDFSPDGQGIAFSDAVGGRFPLATTSDGESWESRWGPDAQPGEGGFAASGTCLLVLGDRTVLVGTGNADVARVLRSDDGGRTWLASPTTLVAGEGAGITTLAFRDVRRGAAMGGDLAQPDAYTNNVAITEDGGRTWRPATHPTFRGAVYGSSYVPGAPTLVAVGPNGVSYSHDDAASWSPADSLSYWSVDFVTPSAGWAVGPDGRIARLRLRSKN